MTNLSDKEDRNRQTRLELIYDKLIDNLINLENSRQVASLLNSHVTTLRGFQFKLCLIFIKSCSITFITFISK
jgi:hypothetical protein